MGQLNPIQGDGVVRIEEISPDVFEVETEDGEVVTVDGDECSCGHVRDYTPSRSAGFEQSYRERRQASCSHQAAVLNAERLGPCDECGEFVVRKQELRKGGRHAMSKYTCASCGATVGNS